VPFFVGYYALTLFGLEGLESALIATALTATSIAIAALSVVTTMVQTENLTPDIVDITS
jgi:Kef-type K+ transport system membrane component KefB